MFQVRQRTYDARQYDGTNAQEIVDFQHAGYPDSGDALRVGPDGSLSYATEGGRQPFPVGDWWVLPSAADREDGEGLESSAAMWGYPVSNERFSRVMLPM